MEVQGRHAPTGSLGGGRLGADLATCWISVSNPTAERLSEAEHHRQYAADHRAASAALGAAEAGACAGLGPDDRDASPFTHVEDIAAVQPLIEHAGTSKAPTHRRVGAVIVFRAIPGMTVQWLQRLVDCHLARNASVRNVVPEMPDCPLVPSGVQARVSSRRKGFAVAIRSADAATAREILARAERLRTAARVQAAKRAL